MNELLKKAEEIREKMLNYNISQEQWDIHFWNSSPEFTLEKRVSWINNFINEIISSNNLQDFEWLEYYYIWYTTEYDNVEEADFEFEVLCLK